MKFWEILLLKQRERGNDGLTLPFLIGSQGFLPEFYTATLLNTSTLIHDIVLTNTIETCIRYCIGTHTLIFEVKKPKNSVYFPTYYGKQQTNLSVSIMLKESLGNSVEVLIDNLTVEFQQPINNGLFSAEMNSDSRYAIWHKFKDDDIQFIKNSFGLF